MSPSAVPLAVRQGSRSVMEVVAMGPNAGCSPQHVPSAAKIPRYPSNPAVINRFTVAIATAKSDLTDNGGVRLGHTRAGDT